MSFASRRGREMASAILPFPPADAHIRGCPARTPALAARAAVSSAARARRARDAPGGDLFDEELGEGPHQRIGAVRRGASAAHAEARRVGRVALWLRTVEGRRELAHLVFERRERAQARKRTRLNS